jgi:hypothetical protein
MLATKKKTVEPMWSPHKMFSLYTRVRAHTEMNSRGGRRFWRIYGSEGGKVVLAECIISRFARRGLDNLDGVSLACPV